MKNEKINIAELLRGCPQGMELDSPLFDGLEFDHIGGNTNFPIVCRIKTTKGYTTVQFTEDGKYVLSKYSKCVIFPKGKTTWDGFVPAFRFRVGERIQEINRAGENPVRTVTGIGSSYYTIDGMWQLYFGDEDQYRVVKWSADLFKPFDKVLTRNASDCRWTAGFFSHYEDGEDTDPMVFVVSGGDGYWECIPYEGNEHLLGTTDKCNGYYKLWEDE